MAAAKTLTPEQRSARARFAALAGHARGKTNTGPAIEASMARFEREVREYAEAHGETLTDAEAARRADFAKRAYFTRLAFYSSRAKQAQKLALRTERGLAALEQK